MKWIGIYITIGLVSLLAAIVGMCIGYDTLAIVGTGVFIGNTLLGGGTILVLTNGGLGRP